ncbi:MAG TPA: AAA-associated domain-containing protein, partial [Rhizomicrobium sp.]
RERTSTQFEDYVDRIYVEMTARRVERMRQQQTQGSAIEMPLHHVSPNQISGLIEALSAPRYEGKADLPDIAYEQELEVDELFPVAEAMQLLRLAEVEGGDIKLTHMGKRFADADLNERKEIFSRSIMNNVPLAAHIRKILDERASHSAPKTRFLDELEDHMAEDAAEETLKTVVSWARFSELFSYDDDAALFSLENPT